MSQRLAEIHERNGKLIVASYSKPAGWLWFMNGWFRIIDSDAPDAELGRTIQEALARSEVGVPKPPREGTRAGLDRPILAALGIPSTSAYMNGAKSVAVTRDDNASGLELTPRENRLCDGFVEIKEAAHHVPADLGAGELASAVRRALARATDRPMS